MNPDPPQWRETPILRELHRQWWGARGRRVGQSSLPFSRGWEDLLEDAGLTSAELRAEAERDVREFCAAGLVEIKPPRLRPRFIERIRIPVNAEERLARLFGDALAPEEDAFDPASVAWAPEMAFLVGTRIGVLAEDLLKINQFLAAGGRDRPLVPIKERSVTIFGDEKRLDALRSTALFRDGRLRLADLRCESVAEPLAWLRGPERTGRFLVVENAATFRSFANWNARRKAFTAVIYGGGYRFVDGIGFLSEIFKEAGEVGSVLYFGDLDPEGLRIPCLGGERTRRLGVGPVEAFLPAYRYLLDLPATCRSNLEDDPSTDHIAWLNEMADEAEALFNNRQRIAQEWLGWEHLAEGSEGRSCPWIQ